MEMKWKQQQQNSYNSGGKKSTSNHTNDDYIRTYRYAMYMKTRICII